MQTHTKTYLANDVGGLRNLTRQVERSTPPQRLHYANCHLQIRKKNIKPETEISIVLKNSFHKLNFLCRHFKIPLGHRT